MPKSWSGMSSITWSRLKSGVSSSGSTATALGIRLIRGASAVTVSVTVVTADADAVVGTFVAGVNFTDLASLTLSSVDAVAFGAGVVASGGYKPFTDNALPNNGLKYCTNCAKRRAVF